MVWAVTDEGVVGGDSIGELGKRAETVGEEAARKLVRALNSRVAIDRHALDNVVIYMAIAAGTSSAASTELTSHAKTAMDLCSWITGAEFSYDIGENWVVVNSKGIGLSF